MAWRLILYGALVLAPVVITAATGSFAGRDTYRVAGRAAALLAFPLLVLQPVISARFHWIERPFGLDRLLVFHRATGTTALCLALLHPVLLAVSGRSWRLITSLDLPWQLLVGKAVLVVLLVYAIGALFHGLLRVPFQWWLRAHNAFAPAILAGAFVHSWAIDIQRAPLTMRLLWLGLLAAGTFAYLHLTLFQRLRARRRAMAVTDVSRVASRVWGLRMEPDSEGEGLDHLPGQFMFVTLLRGRGLPSEEHPFTIASAPGQGGELEIAPKELGDFTSTVGETEPGDRAAVMGPFGRFSYLLRPERRRLVMVAGGIGITPFMSMLRHMRDRKEDREVLLLYGNRTQSDIAFADELAGMAEGDGPPGLKVVHVLSAAPEDWKGERGYIDGELLRRYVGGTDETGFYICGPPAMMEKVSGALRDMGVPAGRVHSERFSL
jgi:predicted ferric reductase